MAGQKSASALVFLDFETDGLPNGNDFFVVHPLEFGMVVTNLDLEPIAGYHEVIKMTPEAAKRIASNEYVKSMHQKNGLLKESIQTAGHTLADVEREIIEVLHETGLDKGEFVIAGSGIASFDFPLIKALMPELATWFAYFTLDIGVLRRGHSILSGGRTFYPKVNESYGDAKTHRAYEDAEAHLKEAQVISKWLKEL